MKNKKPDIQFWTLLATELFTFYMEPQFKKLYNSTSCPLVKKVVKKKERTFLLLTNMLSLLIL